jgi:hypothetical protein
MTESQRLKAEITDGPVAGVSHLFDYLRSPAASRDAEPPRKRRRTEQTKPAEKEVDEAEAVLLASMEIELVSISKVLF